MNLAFCLFRYFPFGGLQKDFMRIAERCVAKGHHVDVYTMQWEGTRPKGLSIILLKVKGFQNHTKIKNFIKITQAIFNQKKYDKIIGFNKMPGLDLYYAADPCLLAKLKTQNMFWLKRFLPHYRILLNNELAVFSFEKKTKILLIAKKQQAEFIKQYHTQPDRFYLLPPGITQQYINANHAEAQRKKLRDLFHIEPSTFLLLFVGSGFRTKGLDRVLTSLATLPKIIQSKTKLWVVGQDKTKPFLQQAKSLGIENQLVFLGGRNDVLQFMLAADLFVHPARSENTGTVLLEALSVGLPVLTTDVCGYAEYIIKAKAGIVLNSPYNQKKFTQTIEEMLLSKNKLQWKKNAIHFAQNTDLYHLIEYAVHFIESS